MTGSKENTGKYDGRRTLIIGDVNTGKTRLTEQALASWTAQGRSKSVVVLDLAPQPRGGIGGRLARPAGFQGVCLATPIVPPRLSARDEGEAEALARANAEAIEVLLENARRIAAPILVINDVTLYLQAGNYEQLLRVVQASGTVLINAYYGNSFPEYALSQRERRRTERLIQDCDRIIRLPAADLPDWA